LAQTRVVEEGVVVEVHRDGQHADHLELLGRDDRVAFEMSVQHDDHPSAGVDATADEAVVREREAVGPGRVPSDTVAANEGRIHAG